MEILHRLVPKPANWLHAKIEIMGKQLIGDRETRRIDNGPEMSDSGNERRDNEHPEKISYTGNNEEQYRRQQTPLHQLPQARYKKTAYRCDYITTRTLSYWHYISLSIIHHGISCLLYRHLPLNAHNRYRPHSPPFSFRGSHPDCRAYSSAVKCH